jgi:glycosyltransferase involved in cell wall biosynthesis
MITGGTRNSVSIGKQPKISIITVVLNGEQFIDDYLQNVLGFLNADVELIMVDGNSTDKTIDRIQQHSHAIDYWCSEPDAGIYDAMNKAIKLAKGQWLYFMGIDDRLLDGFSEIATLLTDPHTIYYGNVMSYGKLMARVYDAYFLTKLNICHQAIFYPTSVFNKYQYNTRYLVYADYYLNLQCWHDPEFTFAHCDKLVAAFPGGGFSTYTRDLQFEQDRDWLFKTFLGPRVYYRYINRTKGTLRMLKTLIAG